MEKRRLAFTGSTDPENGFDMTAINDLFKILVFPGFLFVVNLGLFLEWVDRKIYARLQNRIGPPWYQPWLDVLKLFSKEDVIPEGASSFMFTWLPVFYLAVTVTAFLCIPVGTYAAVYSFPGDLIVVLFLLTLATIILFLLGWYSGSPFGRVGAVRAVTQFLAYEVPLVAALLTQALLADSWSISLVMARTTVGFPRFVVVHLIALAVALISLQGKLLRVPFDAPEAETEIVAGPFTEYTGRRLAFIRLAERTEMAVGVGLVSDLFLPFPARLGVFGFVISTILVTFVLSVLRASVARFRIEDTTVLAWKYVLPFSALGMVLAIIVRG